MTLKSIIFVAVAAAASLCSCSSGNKASSDGNSFKTTHVAYADSIEAAGDFAVAKVAGDYPDTPGVVSDSIVAWLVAGSDVSEPVTDGNGFVRAEAEDFFESARADFEQFPDDSLQYELQYSFGKLLATDKVVTAFYNSYSYRGGAHGITVYSAATFRVSDGHRLSASDVFAEPSSPSLLAEVREALAAQYFKDEINDSTTLADMLLVSPSALTLPSNPPYFMREGIALVYQQYEIAPYSSGMPQVVLPYDDIKKFMTADAVKLIP